MRLPQVKQDRANHFIYGFCIFTVVNIFLQGYIALLAVALVGLAKELYDEYDYGGFDIVDFIYTLSPAVILFINSLFSR